MEAVGRILFVSLVCVCRIASGGVQSLPALPNGAVANSVQVDASGNIYVGGWLPPSSPKSPDDIADAFAAKLSPDGFRIIWQTAFAGSAADRVSALVVGNDNSVYLTGNTTSADFPTTRASMQPLQGYPGLQGFAAKLDANGQVRYATYLGGPAQAAGNAIAANSEGEAFVTGQTTLAGFAVTAGAVAGDPSSTTGFILKLDTAGAKALIAIRGFGGNGIALDAQGNIYAAGAFDKPVAPTTPGAFQTGFHIAGCGATFIAAYPCRFQHIAKIHPSGAQLIYATYIAGASGAVPSAIAVDASGGVIVAGRTNSPDYPTTPAAYQPEYFAEPKSIFLPPHSFMAPLTAGYVTKLSASGSALVWSTFFGGSGGVLGQQPFGDTIDAMAIDAGGNVLLAGLARSPDLPGLSSTPVASRPTPGGAGFTVRLSSDGQTLSPAELFPARAVSAIAVRPDGTAMIAPSLIRVSFSSPGRVAAIADSADGAKVVSVAPGELLTLYGTDLAPGDPAQPPDGFPASFNGVTVTFNGIAAPILYTSKSQINLQVPFEIAGESEVAMQVSSQAVTAPVMEAFFLAVVDRQPSIFIAPDTFGQPIFDVASCGGETAGAILPVALNGDGTRNSCANPASAGSTVTVFLNGLGVSSPASVLLQDQTTAPPVSLFVGPAPGSIAGLAQVRIPVSSSTSSMKFTLEVQQALKPVPVRGPGLIVWTMP